MSKPLAWTPSPNMFSGPTRITHIKVTKPPIDEPFGRFLLRNAATNSRARVALTRRQAGHRSLL
jgi:hypothetical protein